jgi:hypothetical protein
LPEHEARDVGAHETADRFQPWLDGHGSALDARAPFRRLRAHQRVPVPRTAPCSTVSIGRNRVKHLPEPDSRVGSGRAAVGVTGPGRDPGVHRGGPADRPGTPVAKRLGSPLRRPRARAAPAEPMGTRTDEGHRLGSWASAGEAQRAVERCHDRPRP